MKKNQLILVFLLAALQAWGSPINKKLHIESATVFLHGAQLTSSASLHLGPGEQEVVCSNVAANVNTSSIIINATGGVAVKSVVFKNNYLNEAPVSARVTQINDSIKLLEKLRKRTAGKIALLDEQVKMIENNRTVRGDNSGLNVAEFSKMLELVTKKTTEVQQQRYTIEDELALIDERNTRLKQQLGEEQQRGVKPGGQLVVTLYTTRATSTVLLVTYLVGDAGWSPVYDVIAQDVHSPIKFQYKANVYQNSGISWDSISLTLSSGNPVEGATAPTVQPWHIGFPRPVYTKNRSEVSPGSGYPQAVSMHANDIKTLPTTEMSDVTSLAPALYQQQRGSGVSVGGARKSGTLYIIDGVQVQNIGDDNTGSGMAQHASVDATGVNTRFDIDLPYTIPSDGKTHLVVVKEASAPATYHHYTAPRLDPDVFLLADVTGWETLDLLSGPANIFFEGTYVGQGYINTANVRDTLSLSLGRDKKVVVKRELDKQLRSVRTIGSNVRETFAYTTSVRNTRHEAVNLVVEDQLPVSIEKDVVVEKTESGDAGYNETTGALKWTFTAAASESRDVKFGFAVKYPKNKTISGLR